MAEGLADSIWRVQASLDRARRGGELTGLGWAAGNASGRGTGGAAASDFASALAALLQRLGGLNRSSVPAAGQSVGATGTGPYDRLIEETAARERVDPALVRAVVRAESGFNPRAVSSAGAKGLMQLMDGTARSLGVSDPFDPAQNLAGGVRYLKQMLQRYQGDARLALAAYNAGPGAVDRYGGVPPYAETQGYVRRVLQERERQTRA